MTAYPHTAPRPSSRAPARLARIVSLALLALSAQAYAQALPPLPSAAFAPINDQQQIVAGARGLWFVPGYGMALDLKQSKAELYHYAGGLCWRDPVVPEALLIQQFIPYYGRSQHPRDFAFALSPESTQLHAQAATALPASCAAGIDRSSALYQFDAATFALRDYYAFAGERGVDWSRRIARLRPSAAVARSPTELRAIFTELLRGLDDAHTGISGEIDGHKFAIESERGYTFRRLREIHARQSTSKTFFEWLPDWLAEQRRQADGLLLPGTRKELLDGKLVWGRLEGNVGYLQIAQMMEFGKEGLAEDRRLIGENLDKALLDLQGTDSLVLDIAHNIGGSDEVSNEIAARFADRSRLAYTKHAIAATAVRPQPFRAEPRGQAQYRKPVYLLTSELTASAAEVFGLLMRSLPNVLQVGQPTQGVFSDALFKALPNGWHLTLSNEVYRDSRGEVFEGRGLPPDLAIAVYPAQDFDNGYRKALGRVARVAARQH
ncbi:MAG: S41 family peptidase [Lysobacter sp.]